MWHESTGRIIYDPDRGTMKRRTEWWCVVNVDPEITRYYRWWLQRELHIKNLHAPAWDAHISVVRGENPGKHAALWKRYNHERVRFKYSHNVRASKKPGFWNVEIDCPKLMSIREELGLPTYWRLHITVARRYE